MKKAEINKIINSCKRQHTTTIKNKIWALNKIIADRSCPKSSYFSYNYECRPRLDSEQHLTEYDVDICKDFSITYGRLWGYVENTRYSNDYIMDNTGRRLNIGDLHKFIDALERLLVHRHVINDSLVSVDGLDAI